MKMNRDNISWRRHSQVKSEIGSLKDKYIKIKSKSDLYFSDHFIWRLIERRLEKDLLFVIKIVKYFMENVFYETTYSARSYLLSFKGLQVGISVSVGIDGFRRATVTTVFENNNTYECDEAIELN